MVHQNIIFRKKVRIIFLYLSLIMFSSCEGQTSTDSNCIEKLKEARNLVYKYATSSKQSTLDSALELTNDCLKCDFVKKAAVDLKIRILIGMKKYAKGRSFVDSLKKSDFTFPYKKKAIYNTFLALEYEAKNDTFKSNYSGMLAHHNVIFESDGEGFSFSVWTILI